MDTIANETKLTLLQRLSRKTVLMFAAIFSIIILAGGMYIVAALAPTAPTNLSGIGGDEQVTLEWTAAETEGESTIVDYVVEYKASSESEWIIFEDEVTDSTGAVVTELTNGTAYDFRVYAINSDEEDSVGDPSDTTTVTPFTVPDAPTGVTAVRDNGEVTVSFDAPAFDGGSEITLYTVTSSPGGFTGTGSSSPITVSGLTNGTAYTFTVTATNAAGAGSASSASASVTPATLPDAPTSVSAVRGNGQATVTFTAPVSNGGAAITSYTVTSSPGDVTASGSGSPITVTGLTNGTAYTFTVTATNEIGTGDASSASTAVTPATTPGAPTGLTASPSNGQVELSWSAPSETGGLSITDYVIEYSLSNQDNWTVFSDSVSTSTSAVVTGLANGTEYDFRISAVNDAGQGVASVVATTTPRTVPGAPTSVSATPGNGQATVSFTAPASNGGSAITSYTVTSSPGGFTGTGSSSPITVSGLTNGTAYTFTVTATNAAGTGSASSASASTTPRTVPGAPTGVSAVRGNGQASVSFTAPASNGGATITSYTVTSSPSGVTASGTSSPITVSGLTNGTAYTFTVTATNAAGTGSASSPSAAVTPATTPGAPTALSATPTSSQIALSWSAPSSNGGSAITDYVVEYSLSGEGDWVIFSDGTASTTGATVTGLTNGIAYDFRISAVNEIGQGATSAIVTSTPRTVPGAPTSVSATPGNGSASVSFTVPASNGGSAITSYTVTSSPGGVTASGASSPITVSGLTNGTAYTFTVTATNAAGTGSASSASSSVTPRTTPDAPTGVSATPGNGQATVSFTAPASNGGSAITSYTVTSSPGGFTGTGSGSPIIVNGLTNGTAYTFTVTATNAAGTGSASSASSSVTPRTIPGAPTSVSATPGNGQATVSFTAPASNGGSAITSYTVTSSPGGFTGTGSTSPVTVSGLANGTAYTFTVTATNAAGTSAASSPSATVTPRTIPGAPTGVSATPGNGSASVSFTAPASNGGSAITGYTVTSSPGGVTANGTSSPITVSGLTNGTAYTFTVIATNVAGNSPASSASSAITPAAVPDEPSDLTVTPGNGQVQLSWTAPSDNGSSLTDYVIEWSVSGANSWTIFADGVATTTAATVTGLTNGTAYDFRVSAVNAAGQGLASGLATTTPRTIPGAPTALTAASGNAHISLSWSAPASNGGSSITDYRIEYSLSGTNDWMTFSDGTSADTSAIVTGLENDINYDFRVSAINAAGTSPASVVISATPALPTTTISTIAATPTDTTAVVTWKTDIGASSQVEYGPSESFGMLTPVTDDTGLRPTDHSVTLSDLNQCTTYSFRVISQPEDGGITTSNSGHFITTGCIGDSEVVEQIIETVSEMGGTVKIDNDTSGVASLTLTFAAGSVDDDVVVQVKRLEGLAENVTGKPGATLLVSNGQVYDIKAVAVDGTLVTDFNQPITFTLKYSNQDVKGLDESTIKLYNWHENNWNALSDCAVDAQNNTITCTTSQFSLFALFGQAAPVKTPPVQDGKTQDEDGQSGSGSDNGTGVDTGNGAVDEDDATNDDVVDDEQNNAEPKPSVTDTEDDEKSEKGSVLWWIIGGVVGLTLLTIIIAKARRSKEG